MLLQRVPSLPEGPGWVYEVKLDGYRALAVKAKGRLLLRSRNNKDFNSKYSRIVTALAAMPDDTAIDGEVVALDETDRPSFNLLQNAGTVKLPVGYCVFDVLCRLPARASLGDNHCGCAGHLNGAEARKERERKSVVVPN